MFCSMRDTIILRFFAATGKSMSSKLNSETSTPPNHLTILWQYIIPFAVNLFAVWKG